MGVRVSHDAFEGSWGELYQWCDKLARATGLYLDLMEGYGSLRDTARYPFPLRWSLLEYDILHALFTVSDGRIETHVCAALADRLEVIMPRLPDADHSEHWSRDYWRTLTQQFIEGLRRAASRNEPLEFRG